MSRDDNKKYYTNDNKQFSCMKGQKQYYCDF